MNEWKMLLKRIFMHLRKNILFSGLFWGIIVYTQPQVIIMLLYYVYMDGWLYCQRCVWMARSILWPYFIFPSTFQFLILLTFLFFSRPFIPRDLNAFVKPQKYEMNEFDTKVAHHYVEETARKKKSVQPFSCEMRWRHGDRWFKDDVVNFWLCDSKSPTKLIRYYKDPACFNWNILQFSSFSRKILLLAIQ